MKDKISVTGGTSYIGSHTGAGLIQNDLEVVITDNFSNPKTGVLDSIKKVAGTRNRHSGPSILIL